MIFKNNNTFHLQGKNTSYIIVVGEYNDLFHYHFGGKLVNADYSCKVKNCGGSWIPSDNNGTRLETARLEYPAFGNLDMRTPAYSIENKFGNTISRLRYKDYTIRDGVANIEGMPGVFAGDKQAQTLEITLVDENIGLEVVLSYTVFDEYDIIARSAKIINNSDCDMTIDSAYSASMDMGLKDFDVVCFPGGWAREREFVRNPIADGTKIDISNARGASGNSMNPFAMLCAHNADENTGDVYGFSLIYSGNHSTFIEHDIHHNIRVMQGINPYGFEKVIAPGEAFFTPQSVLSYSNCGFGGITRTMHDLYRNNLCRSKWANMNRPILVNNWEATYFDFNEEKLLELAKKAKELGIELLVLDDGWFGKRDNDSCSLGDWYVNRRKLPSGLSSLSQKINDIGLKFGIWIEPEMVNPDSDLYRAHPDWAIAVPNVVPAKERKQYMLDLSKPEVCDFIIESVSNTINAGNIMYIKWDHNRPMTDMPRKGFNHEFVLGLYRIMDTLLERFPDILFEGCASGGARFDPGMLAYCPQIWTSDNTDAFARMKIQYSTSICYPISAISSHVTASPNHQIRRITPLKSRADTAFFGGFGYELDINKLSDEETEEIKEQIKFYKKIQTLLRTGDLYRLKSPFETNYCSWQIVSKDKKEVYLYGSTILTEAVRFHPNFILGGLDENLVYVDQETGETYGGDELMKIGFMPKFKRGDFLTFTKVFKAQ